MANGITELTNLIPEIWSPKMYDRLKNKIAFANLFAKDYEGEIKNVGDTVNVNTIGALAAETLSSDKAQFSSQSISVTQNQIVANRQVVNAVEITDLAKLQSLEFQAKIQEELVYGLQLKMEQDIIAALLPSTSAPDHTIAPASAGVLAAVDCGSLRALLSTAKVPLNNRYLALAPSYFTDLLNSTTVTSMDFVSGNSAESGVLAKFMGFQIFEHDLLDADVGYAFHPSAIELVMQQSIRVKISDLHSQNKLGYLISADMVWGYKLMDSVRLAKISG